MMFISWHIFEYYPYFEVFQLKREALLPLLFDCGYCYHRHLIQEEYNAFFLGGFFSFSFFFFFGGGGVGVLFVEMEYRELRIEEAFLGRKSIFSWTGSNASFFKGIYISILCGALVFSCIAKRNHLKNFRKYL